jgi:hypothetical protein
MTSKDIFQSRITNLTELEQFCEMVRLTVTEDDGDVVYLNTDIRLTLVRERLTDGSHVFDIRPALVLENSKRRA